MRIPFLTGSDQIIDIDQVAAIETEGVAVFYHLKSGPTIKSVCKSKNGAAEEKWSVYQRLGSCTREDGNSAASQRLRR
jgi:hypothetical protein